MCNQFVNQLWKNYLYQYKDVYIVLLNSAPIDLSIFTEYKLRRNSVCQCLSLNFQSNRHERHSSFEQNLMDMVSEYIEQVCPERHVWMFPYVITR